MYVHYVGSLNKMGNQKYKDEIVNNKHCILCDDWIPINTRKPRYRLFCTKECTDAFYRFRKDNGLLDYPLAYYGRQAHKHKKEVHRY